MERRSRRRKRDEGNSEKRPTGHPGVRRVDAVRRFGSSAG